MQRKPRTLRSPSGKCTRRELLKATLASAAISHGNLSYAARRSSADRPNILFLMTDQHRGDCIGADGNRVILTPNLDWIASEGARFRRAYTSTPSCIPARAALLTGLSPWHHGMLGYGQIAEKYPFELPRALSDAGYYTIAIGKNHFFPPRNTHGYKQVILQDEKTGAYEQFLNYRSDYHSWFYSEAPNLDPNATGLGVNNNDYRARAYALPERFHIVRWVGETAVRFLKSYNRPQPFLLKVSFERPHSPYDPPDRYMRDYAHANIPPAVIGKWAERLKAHQGPGYAMWQGDVGSAQVRKSREGYYGLVTFLDDEIGRILEALDERGWLEQTFIFFTADHGDMLGDHYLWFKCQPYEPSARIPMLMRWPKGVVSAGRGQVISQVVELRDVLPTFLEVAGAAPPASVRLDGQSLLALVRGQNSEWRPWIDLEHAMCYTPENCWNALTDGNTKYIFHAWNGTEQLFDLDHDPAELNDLSATSSYASLLRIWRQRMVEHLAKRGEEWVRNGKLMRRTKSPIYSPNYPGTLPGGQP